MGMLSFEILFGDSCRTVWALFHCNRVGVPQAGLRPRRRLDYHQESFCGAALEILRRATRSSEDDPEWRKWRFERGDGVNVDVFSSLVSYRCIAALPSAPPFARP